MFDSEFFPTPYPVAKKMLEKVSSNASYFLEPSAGKGDLVDAIKKSYRWATIDCIEQSPDLVALLQGKDHTVVGFDWLSYSGVCYYDAVVMNPPFSNGDEHLLKAWDFLHEGEIVCLLNEQTILNPYTPSRTRLVDLINKNGYIEYIGDCFSTAERPTDVRVALVYLKKVSEDDSVDLWADLKGEEVAGGDIGAEPNMLALQDTLGNMQHYYDMANDHMLKAFHHIRRAAKYMEANGIYLSSDYEKAASVAFKNLNSAKADFGQKHRKDAWMHVFERMEFRKWLDKKQTDNFIRDIERNGNIPFTKENIKGTLENVFLQRNKLFELSVANVFQELTRYFKGNGNHTEGWKSNESYKVNEKLVFPWGCEYCKIFNKFQMRWSGSAIDIYNDLDRVMCMLDGTNFDTCNTIARALKVKFQELGAVSGKFDNVCKSQYFDIKFFKKGTIHLSFSDSKLWEKFNITAAKGRNWLGENTQQDKK